LRTLDADYGGALDSAANLLQFVDTMLIVGARVIPERQAKVFKNAMAMVRQHLKKVKGDERRLNPILGREVVKLRAMCRQILPMVLRDTGLTEVKAFFDATDIAIHELPLSDGLERAANEYLRFVAATVESGETYPLFDAQTSQYVSAGIEAGLIQPAPERLTRGKSAPIVARLFDRLPVFDSATPDEIVDIRRELAGPLSRFRAGILDMATSIRPAAWESGFDAEVGDLILRRVDPAIAEIDETVRANPYLLSIATRVLTSPVGAASGSALALLVSSLSALPHLTTAALVGGALGEAAEIYKAHREWEERIAAAKTNQLYFYYHVKSLPAR
jgi:hypothetical protein